MNVTLNGETRPLEGETDLAKLVEHLALPQRRIAVELNGSVVRRADWSETKINAGDKIEVVHFVGGG